MAHPSVDLCHWLDLSTIKRFSNGGFRRDIRRKISSGSGPEQAYHKSIYFNEVDSVGET
jgi:hypothetical protein